MYTNRAFSLLELLIVVAILAIIGGIGSGFYVNYGNNIEVKSVADTLASDLKQAQSKSMIGEGSLKWGVHFVNGTTDYYEIFSTPTDYSSGSKVIIATKYLTSKITFSDPVSSSQKDIIFQKIKGGIDSSSTGGGVADMPIVIQSASSSKTITASLIGNIYIQ